MNPTERERQKARDHAIDLEDLQILNNEIAGQLGVGERAVFLQYAYACYVLSDRLHKFSNKRTRRAL